MNNEEAALIKQFGKEFRKKIAWKSAERETAINKFETENKRIVKEALKTKKQDLEQLQREAFVPPCTMYPRE
jgi:hypothetical protein